MKSTLLLLTLFILSSERGEGRVDSLRDLNVLITGATHRDGHKIPGGPDRWTINYLHLVGNSQEREFNSTFSNHSILKHRNTKYTPSTNIFYKSETKLVL